MKTEIEFLLYNLPDEEGRVQVVIKDENVWATQKVMSQLFGCSTDNMGLHLKNIFAANELDKDSVTEKISATASDGKKYLTTFYSLDAIISVGYRVSFARATKFRQCGEISRFQRLQNPAQQRTYLRSRCQNKSRERVRHF